MLLKNRYEIVNTLKWYKVFSNFLAKMSFKFSEFVRFRQSKLYYFRLCSLDCFTYIGNENFPLKLFSALKYRFGFEFFLEKFLYYTYLKTDFFFHLKLFFFFLSFAFNIMICWHVVTKISWNKTNNIFVTFHLFIFPVGDEILRKWCFVRRLKILPISSRLALNISYLFV